MELPFAEDLPYWKTGQSSPDTWISKAIAEIERAGGEVTHEAFGSEPMTGRAAFMIGFHVNGDAFKLIWPICPTKSDNVAAARRQAATMLYHDVKARCVTARVLGARVAFFAHLALPDGRRASDLAIPELQRTIPKMLTVAPGEE